MTVLVSKAVTNEPHNLTRLTMCTYFALTTRAPFLFYDATGKTWSSTLLGQEREEGREGETEEGGRMPAHNPLTL